MRTAPLLALLVATACGSSSPSTPSSSPTSCVGFRDAGNYAPIPKGDPFTSDGTKRIDEPCSASGCWYACELGPCAQMSTCAPGLACVIPQGALVDGDGQTFGNCEAP